MRTTLLFAKTQLKRSFRDPITLIVLFAIPLLLLVLFGAFMGGADNIQLRVAVINNSREPFAQEFAKSLTKLDVLELPDEQLTLDQAREKMRNDELDGIVQLPESFGKLNNNAPTGKVQIYHDETDVTTGDIVSGVINSVVDASNNQITGSQPPLTVERVSIAGTGVQIFDGLFAMFTSIAIMMVGIFGVGSTIPSDKKAGILRRLRVTPLKSSQLVIGTMLAFTVISLLAVTLMTVLAVTVFNLDMKGNLLEYGCFVLLSTILMLGFGLAIGGWAKNSTQADVYGQIVFLASLAFSGLWVPRVLMPEWLQGITTYMPLTPVIEGIRGIVTEGVSLVSMSTELLIIVVWTVVVFVVGIKTFKWE